MKPSSPPKAVESRQRQSLWLRLWKAARGLRFVYLQVAIGVIVGLFVRPFLSATALPNPSLPRYTPEPSDLQETLVLGSTTFAPGTLGAVRVVVYDPRARQPLSDVKVDVTLVPHGQLDAVYPLFSGQTDDLGTTDVVFPVPDGIEGECDLVVDTAGPVGAQRVTRAVKLLRQVRLEMMVSQPVYQPTETIRARAQVLDHFTSLPVPEHPITFTVVGPRGHRVWTGMTVSSRYGVAHLEYELAERVDLGEYRITAALGDETAERVVVVRPRVASPFSVRVQPTEPYYRPGQRVEAAVRATYPWGQPVARAQVEVVGRERGTAWREVGRANGQTDANGTALFKLEFGGAVLDDADPRAVPVMLDLTAQVTDRDGQVGVGESILPLADQPILVEGVAESWALKPGIENVIGLSASYPDGRPAECSLSVEAAGLGGQAEAETGPDGRGEFRYRPVVSRTATLTVTARDAQGQEARRTLELPVETGEHHVLLRPGQATYHVGETMHLDAFVSQGSNAAGQALQAVYLDVIRRGQSVAVHAAPLRDRRASFDLVLDPGLSGRLELQAYAILADAPDSDVVVVRDVRQVTVDPLSDLEVTLRLDQERYASGDKARVAVRVSDARGWGTQSAVAAMVTGELDGPADACRGFQAECPSAGQALPLDVLDLSPVRAEAVSKARPIPDQVQRELKAIRSVRVKRRRAFALLAEWDAWGLVAIPALFWIVVGLREWGNRPGRLALRPLAGRLLGGLIAVPFLVGGGVLLTHLGRELFGPGWYLVLGLSWFGSLLALLVYAWTRRDGWAQTLWTTVVGYLALAAGLRYATAQGGQPPARLLVAALAAFPVGLLALYSFGSGLMRRREASGTVTALAVILVSISTLTTGLSIDARDLSPTVLPLDVSEETPEPTRKADSGIGQADRERSRATVHPTVMALPAPHGRRPVPQALSPEAGPAPEVQGQLSQGDGAPDAVYWEPEKVTDSLGRLRLEIPLPDAPARWRLSVLASTEGGDRGTGQALIETFSPLWVRAELPALLTVGDELDLPVTVYNALAVTQTARIEVTEAEWFKVRTRGMSEQQIEVPAHGARDLHLPLRVVEWGKQDLEITAHGAWSSDVVSLPVDVVPDGRRVRRVYSGRIDGLGQDPAARFKFRVPWGAIRGTDRLTVKLYPSWHALVDEGFAALLGRTGPSFEQNAVQSRARALLASHLDHLDPAVPARRDETVLGISLGYQRLLTFEAAGDGFSSFAGASPDLQLTAYALQCLNEMRPLYPVDPTLSRRTERWLFLGQSDEGTWLDSRMPLSWHALSRAELPFTAYVAWALVESGHAHTLEVRLAIEHLARYLDEAEDPYVLALVANALVAYDRERGALPGSVSGSALDRLAEMAETGEGMAAWYGELETFSGALGSSADSERTALATYALLRAEAHLDLAAQGLAMLADARDPSGRWGSSEATYLALRAFEAAVEAGVSDPGYAEHREVLAGHVTSTAYVTADEVAADPVRWTADASRTHTLSFGELSRGYNDVEITVRGDRVVPYQAVGTYYMPWDQVTPPSPDEEEVSVEASYDGTSVEVGETIAVTVGVGLNRPGVAPLVVVEMGVPPGMSLIDGEWQSLRERGVIADYELEDGRIDVYLTRLSAEHPIRLEYHLLGKYPASVKTRPIRAFDLANPHLSAVREPVQIQVLAAE